MSLGGYDMDTILPALNDQAKVFQKEINRQSNMKFTPRVSFKTDRTFDEVERINTLLNEVKIEKDDEE